MPQSPKNLLEEITCDADLFHLGSEKYKTSVIDAKRKGNIKGITLSGAECELKILNFLNHIITLQRMPRHY